MLMTEQVKVAQALIGVGKQLSVSDAGLQIANMVGLVDLPGGASMTKGEVAQAVQAPAFPEFCAQTAGEASSVVAMLKSCMGEAACNANIGSAGTSDLLGNVRQLRHNIIYYAQEGVGGT